MEAFNCDPISRFAFDTLKINLSHYIDKIIDIDPHQKLHIVRIFCKYQCNLILSLAYDPIKLNLIQGFFHL